MKLDGHHVEVYDNNGETWDRYTIIIDDDLKNGYGMSDNPNHPQGFNQYIGEVSAQFLDTQKKLDAIPPQILNAIKDRIK